MAKILTITLNPAIDITLELDTLGIGDVNRYHAEQAHAAGKGLNVAQVLHDLGHQLVVTGFLGKNNSPIFEQHFLKQQFDNQFIYVDGATRQNIKIAERTGRMTDLNGSGFFVDNEAKIQLSNTINRLILDIDVIVIAGSLPQGFTPDELAQLIQHLVAQGKKVAVDTSGEALRAAIASYPWLIKPNTDELSDTYQQPVNTVQEQHNLFNTLGSAIENIVISMGANGVNWLHANHPLHATAPHIQVVSTVGAGDSLVAGMVHGLLSGFEPEETLRTATAIASHAVSQIGFHLDDFSKIEKLKQNITIQALN